MELSAGASRAALSSAASAPGAVPIRCFSPPAARGAMGGDIDFAPELTTKVPPSCFEALLEDGEHLDHPAAGPPSAERLADHRSHHWSGARPHGVAGRGGGGEQITWPDGAVLGCDFDQHNPDHGEWNCIRLLALDRLSTDKAGFGRVDASHALLTGAGTAGELAITADDQDITGFEVSFRWQHLGKVGRWGSEPNIRSHLAIISDAEVYGKSTVAVKEVTPTGVYATDAGAEGADAHDAYAAAGVFARDGGPRKNACLAGLNVQMSERTMCAATGEAVRGCSRSVGFLFV